jgi:hypothetical protein
MAGLDIDLGCSDEDRLEANAFRPDVSVRCGLGALADRADS